MTTIDGLVVSGWEPVADVFRANFNEGKELGAACCVYADGQPVIDLWGGLAERASKRRWEKDTIVAVASTTKGATAICAHLLVQRGLLDLNAPVTRYWPEFGAAGKQDVPVRYLLSHQVGLPTIDAQLTFAQLCAWDPVIRALEAQKPLWPPGTEHLYHAQTYGFLVGEVIRRITGKSVGTFFREEIGNPLGLSAWIGLPEAIEPRVSHYEQAPFPYDSPDEMMGEFAEILGLKPAVAGRLVDTLWGPESILGKAGTMNGAISVEDLRSRAWRAAEFPGANMYANAHAVARMYAATVSDVDGVRVLQPDTVAAMTEPQTVHTLMHGVPPDLAPATKNLFNMSLGFWRATPPAMPLLGPASFGHPGSGGSVGAADPDTRVSFGYVTNLWSTVLIDTRQIGLTAAIRKCAA